ncbi:pimeloyl-ACP methyl ester esterase BioH [Aliagarivorans taiwanensis]|uniref:pimeloyl-ACP methyl ester esterase BioH n=1 Tax=Aliagarivorans taiwanensis TaxID=561966 RepID=UPI00047BE250|nr:pimeloyl-ACP methyl ester esterase BioH [Aliagarivorans taiwanensis]
MTALHSEVQGSGPDLVLLHGWGMNGAIWHSVEARLAEHYRIHIVDLPGFGHSPWDCSLSHLSDIAQQVRNVVPEHAVWMGWSLGGLVAKQACLDFGSQIRALITVASSAHFVAKENWPGIKPEVLKGFSAGLQADFSKTLRQFLAIQAMGSANAKQDIKLLRQQLESRPQPQLQALELGLSLLQESDLRARLSEIVVPWLQIFGHSDSLVPRQARESHGALHGNIEQCVLRGSSHAPFVSEPEQFCAEVHTFLSRVLV